MYSWPSTRLDVVGQFCADGSGSRRCVRGTNHLGTGSRGVRQTTTTIGGSRRARLYAAFSRPLSPPATIPSATSSSTASHLRTKLRHSFEFQGGPHPSDTTSTSIPFRRRIRLKTFFFFLFKHYYHSWPAKILCSESPSTPQMPQRPMMLRLQFCRKINEVDNMRPGCDLLHVLSASSP